MKQSISILKRYSGSRRQGDGFYLSDAFSHDSEIPKNSDMYKFMSKFDNGSISFSDIQSAMDSEEYQAVKDKFEFRTYKNEFLVSDMVGTNPIFYHMSNLGSYYEDIEFKYSNREIKLFTLTSYNKIDSDMLGNKFAKRLSEHSKLALLRYPYDQTVNKYLASIRMDNHEDVNGLLMASFDIDVYMVAHQDALFKTNVTELIIKI